MLTANDIGGTLLDTHNGKIRIRSLMESDLPLMLRWLSNTRVLEFYGGRDLSYDLDSLKSHYTEPWDTKYYRAIIEYCSKPVGYCQIYRLDEETRKEYGYTDTMANVFGADQFIGVPELWSQGIGTAYMLTLLSYLWNTENPEVVVVDPHVDNTRAIRAYEKAGFRPVRILLGHEMFEGRHIDCLLMECRRPE